MVPLPEITWRDVRQTPDDGNRYEAIEGELYPTPAPSVRHQTVSERLERALYRLLEDPGHGQVFHAPVGVEFPATGEGVQPDIVFVSRERRGIVAEYWIVDPDAGAVEAWRFGADRVVDRHARFTETLPVLVSGTRTREIDLRKVFAAS